ncbi:hypothetical protein QEZ47_09895 [Aminobacter anthyllidis]|uniref:hypothetical protein n=1 Tax=Aminobacter anthyllidis TaxID=1035067 RepID=UPI002456FF07|nr:hypothetical protein [Aminobacter anthyllidis]MDH4985843.1 hypothetical protein [Aminobacter anthyllidis]
MDTHPRAEDEALPQHEASSQEPEAQLDSVAETLEQDPITVEKAGDGAVEVSDVDGAVVEAASEPVLQATADIELSAEELSDETAVVPETEAAAVVVATETPAETETPSAEVATPLGLAPEDLATEAPATEDAGAATIAAPSIAPGSVSESEFAHMVDDALEAVGGILLFKMRLDEAGEDRHVAAASIGDGARRQFLLLSLPVTGGKLKVESASRSNSPLAKLAEAYVGVVEAFRAAA